MNEEFIQILQDTGVDLQDVKDGQQGEWGTVVLTRVVMGMRVCSIQLSLACPLYNHNHSISADHM